MNKLLVHPQKFRLKDKVNENIICTVVSPYTFDPRKKYEIAMNWIETDIKDRRIIIIPFFLKMYRLNNPKPLIFEKYFNMRDEKEYDILKRFFSQALKKKEILVIFLKSLTDETKKPQYMNIPIRSNIWKSMSRKVGKLKIDNINWSQSEFRSYVTELRSDFTQEILFEQMKGG